LAAKNLYINIEIKAPHDTTIRMLYNYKECVRLVHDLIMKY